MLADEDQVVVTIASLRRQEQFVTTAIDVAGSVHATVEGDCLAEPLCQVRMRTGPEQDAAKQFPQRRPEAAPSPHARREASASVKSASSIRRPTLKGVSAGSAMRSVGEATPSRQNVRLEARFARAAVVDLSNRGEKIVGLERQTADGVDLVDENHDRARPPASRQIPQRALPAVRRREVGVALPQVTHFVFQIELLAQFGQKAAVPLIGGDAQSDGGEIDDRRIDTFRAKLRDGAHHQRGLPHLAGRQDVAELSGAQRVDELTIGVARNVTGRFGRQRPAGDEEARGIGLHVAAGSNWRYSPHRGRASPGDAPRIRPALRRR